jgi:hypothetical protein
MVINALSQLDAPGEYYIDRRNGTLYFWPPAPATGDAEGGAFLSVAPHAVHANGASYLTFANISLLHARGTGAIFENSTGVEVLGCRIANHGANGTHLFGDAHLMQDTEIAGAACMGATVLGGNRTTLTGGGVRLLRNSIHHYARWKRTYQAGIFWAGQSHIFDANNISFAPHNAILGGGNEADGGRGGNNVVFSNNYISHAVMEASLKGGVGVYNCGSYHLVTHAIRMTSSILCITLLSAYIQVSDAGAFYTCVSRAYIAQMNFCRCSFHPLIRNSALLTMSPLLARVDKLQGQVCG